MSVALPLTIKIPWYRRVLYGAVFIFMALLGALPLVPGGEGESLGLYAASGLFAAMGVVGLVMIILAPRASLVVDDQGILLAYALNKKLRKKLLWSEIVRIEAVRSGRQEFLAIECKADAELVEKEGLGASAVRFAAGRMVSDGGRAGLYIHSIWVPSVKKTADLLNSIRTTQNHG